MTRVFLVGYAFGWFGSMPVAGAVAYFVCHRGFIGRSGHGLALAAGAALIETGWCLAVLLGVGELADRWPAAASVARSLGGILLIVLGVVFFVRRRAAMLRITPGDVELRPRLRDEFRLGATLVAFNPAIPFNWLALIAIAISLGFDPDRAPVLFALGVGAGIVSWFALLLRLISAWREKLHVGMLARIQQGFAVLLVAAGCVAVWHAWL
jgi:threonine/homoserine/homoserine lactone efflux protein